MISPCYVAAGPMTSGEHPDPATRTNHQYPLPVHNVLTLGS